MVTEDRQRAEWERIVDTYADMLLRIALHHTQNASDAEDMVQTVFLKLLRLQPDFADTAHEKAWLIRVCINQCHDLMRSAPRQKQVPLDENHPTKANTDHFVVLDAVRALPAKDRDIIYLYYFEGYTTAEIAALLEMNQNTVESRMFRARKRLRNTLEGGWD